MFEPTTSKRRERRAVILLVVITLLTLFAIVGLAFVFYAQSQADASRFYREAQTPSVAATGVPVPATVLFDDFLRQLLYDVYDDSTGTPSALRGHSLARTMYSYNSTGLPDSAVNTEYQNVKAFDGLGRLHTGSETYGTVMFTDDFYYPNYTYYSTDGFVRDPERIGSRANPNAAQTGNPYIGGFNPPYTYPDLNNMFLGAIRASDGAVLMPSYHRPWLVGSYTAGGAAWTSAVGKYQILALRPADMWTQTNPFPTPTAGGYVKNLPGSPGYLVDASNNTYDNNDSYWINIGAPIITMPDGTLVQPLFAPLIVDLDNRVNLNVHGNVRGRTTDTVTSTQVAMHVSNQGWGPWEVNLSKILNADASANGGVPVEWANIFQGNSTNHVVGRYGPNQQPGAGGFYTAAGDTTHFYGQVDYDGCNEVNGYTQTVQMSLPTTLTPFPTFPQGYENGSGISVLPNPPERLNHPSVYNYFQPSGDDTFLAHSNMGGLIYDLATNVALNGSIVGQLCPTNFTDPTNGKRIRQLVTTISFDVDRSGLSPWLNTTLTSPQPTAYGYTTPYANPFLAPGGPAIGFPQLTAYSSYASRPTNAIPEFSPDWRGANALDAQGLVSQVLSRVDLGRFLPSYPHIASGVNASQPNGGALVAYNGRYDDTSVNGWQAIQFQYLAAQSARQQLAADIYTRLVAVTGVPAPANAAAPTAQELQPLRWLAQLAVNIVDFIDEDDISTPFNFYPESLLSTPDAYPPVTAGQPRTSSEYWVFGTELPRIVLNEALGESTPPTGGNGTSTNNVWVELYNPYPYTNYPPASPANPPPSTTQQTDGNAVLLYVPAAGGQSFDSYAQFPPASGVSPGYAPYHISIVDGTNNWPINNSPTTNPTSVLNDNAIGMVPDGYPPAAATAPTRSETPDTDFAVNPVPNVDGSTTQPIYPTANVVSAYVPGGGFFLVGPSPTTFNNAIKAPPGGTVPAATPFISNSTGLAYPVNYAGGTPTPNDTGATGVYVLLRRLANPHMPWDPNPMIPNVSSPGTFVVNPYFNPYVTSDFIQPVTVWNTTTNPTDSSQGKMEPYAGYYNANAALSQLRTQVGGGTGTAHTFGVVNNPAPASGAYDWLTFPDRQLISPMELLMVSGYYPHELTQQFITSDGTANVLKNQHLVPWFDNYRRLYRFFEFAETESRAAGVPVGARIPGKININTVWDPWTLLAIADGGTGVSNHFTDANIYNSANPADQTTVWGKLIGQRTPYLVSPASGNGAIMGTDQPFRSLTPGYSTGDTQYPSGSGIQNTILGSPSSSTNTLIPSTARTDFFSIAGQAHPYFTNELLTKAFNNLTTRSNTFALWLTVGFFTIPNSSNPTQLGAEYTGGTGVPTRHQLFAIIDRSALTLYPTYNDPVTVQSTAGSSVQVLGSNQISITGAIPTWTLTLGTQTNGAFALSYGGQTTAALAYNATTSQIQSALGGLTTIGASNVTVNGPAEGPYTIVLSQNLTAALTANLSTLSAPGNSSLTQAPAPLWNLFLGEQTPLTGATQQTTGAVPGVDTFTLTYNGKTTSPVVCSTMVGSTGAQLAAYPTWQQVQNALASLSSVGAGNVTVTGPNGGPFSITFAQSLTGTLTGNFTTLANPGNASLSQLPIDPNLNPPGPIQPGSILTVDWSGNGSSNMETVQVTGVKVSPPTGGTASPPSFTAVFNKTHAGPFPIYALRFGNPGPQPQFQHLDNGAVVVYYLPVY